MSSRINPGTLILHFLLQVGCEGVTWRTFWAVQPDEVEVPRVVRFCRRG